MTTNAPVNGTDTVGVLQVGQSEIRLWTLPFTIGRSSSNTLTLRDRHLSRTHAQIDKAGDGQGYELTSTASKSPVKVNGKEVETFLLRHGDEIQIRDHSFVFRLVGEDDDDLDEEVLPAVGQEAGVVGQQAAVAAPAAAAAAAAPAPPAEAPQAPATPESTRMRRSPSRAPIAKGDGMAAFFVLGGMVLVGLMGLGALMMHQKKQQSLNRAEELQRLQGELANLRVEVESTRNTYVNEERATRAAWREALADADPDSGLRRPTKPGTTVVVPPAKKQPSGMIPENDPDGTKVSDPPKKDDMGPNKPADPPPVIKKDDPVTPPVKPKDNTPPPTEPKDSDPKDPIKPPSDSSKDPTEPKPKPKATDTIPFFGHKIDKKNIVFVCDKSASMKPVMERLYAEVEGALDSMTDEHKFTMVFFDSVNRFFSRKLVDASDKRMKGLAKRFTRMQSAQGDTNPLPALQAALKLKNVEALVFVTDGNLYDKEYNFIHNLLKDVTSAKPGKKRVKLFLVPIVRNDKIDKLLKLAEKQNF